VALTQCSKKNRGLFLQNNVVFDACFLLFFFYFIIFQWLFFGYLFLQKEGGGVA